MALTLFTSFLRTLAEDTALSRILRNVTDKDTNTLSYNFQQSGVLAIAPQAVKTIHLDEITNVLYLDISTDQDIIVTIGAYSYRVTAPINPAAATSSQPQITGKSIIMTNIPATNTLTIQSEVATGGVNANVQFTIAGT